MAAQIFGAVQGAGKFDEAKLVLIPADRIEPAKLTVKPEHKTGAVPNGLVGLSQGGGLSDYEDATAAKLKEGGFKWFRTDNVLTTARRKNKEGQLEFDWTAFDQRVDFMYKSGAEPILAASYMPQVLDAVPDNNRQSAPRDYDAWEELCYQAARHSLERGKRVPYWEVWNEVNAGWLKPGPQDTGSAEFESLYRTALGKEEPNREVIRRFEAYAKLYRATAKGVRRADPEAKIGGPALASGPFENEVRGHCQHGRGFARGLMLWCRREKLPLDFLSWHEYFQPADTIAAEADEFRALADASGLSAVHQPDASARARSVNDFFITEWNEAWWADRPHDHELAAAWCADGMIRAMIPKQIRPCLFYVKQGDASFRGDFSILMTGNKPKPTYNMARIFNSLRGDWVELRGGDDDVCGVAALDADARRLAIVLVNFRSRYPVKRQVHVSINRLPPQLAGGQWRESLVDPSHANIFNDANHCELEVTARGRIDGDSFSYDKAMLPNSIVLLELTRDN